jgi:hypothetical protein
MTIPLPLKIAIPPFALSSLLSATVAAPFGVSCAGGFW